LHDEGQGHFGNVARGFSTGDARPAILRREENAVDCRPRIIAALLCIGLSVFVLPGSGAAQALSAVSADSDGLEDVRMPRLREALRQQPRLAQAWFRLRAGDASGARRVLQAAVRETPRDSDALHLYGMAAAATGKRFAAIRALKKSVRIRPDGWVGLHLVNLHLDAGQVRLAARVVDQLEDNLASDLQSRQARAFVLVAQGEFVAARSHLQSIEGDDPSAAAAAQLAELHVQVGELGEAAAAAARAVERAPDDPSYRRRYFEVLLRGEDWSGLLRASGARLASVAGGQVHLYYGGLAALRLDNREQGIELLAALAKQPDADAVALAAATALLFQTDAWDQSEQAARALLVRLPDESGLHHLLALSLSRLHRESEALAHYRRAAEGAGKDPDLHYDLLVSLCTLDRLDEAASRMPKALRDFSEDPRFGALRSQCLPEDDD